MFYVMDFVDGQSLADGKLPGQKPAERYDVYQAMIATLAALHNIDHQTVGLGDYRPPGNCFERQVRRWSNCLVSLSSGTDQPSIVRAHLSRCGRRIRRV